MRLNISTVRFKVKLLNSGGVISGKYIVTSLAASLSTALTGFPFISDTKLEVITMKLVGLVKPISSLLISFRSSVVNSIDI